MRSNRRRDTGPEIALRRALFKRGLRYRVDHPIRCDEGRPIRPDIVFTRVKVAVFIDGCFWHGCPEHQVVPATNQDYWIPKLSRNRERDLEQAHSLRAAGWRVLRFWEHVPADVAAREIEEVLGLVSRGCRNRPAGR